MTTPVIPREDIVPGQNMAPSWRRFFEAWSRLGLSQTGDVAALQQSVADLLQALQDGQGNIPDYGAQLSGKQDHADTLDQLSGLPQSGFVRYQPGLYTAREIELNDLPAETALNGDALVYDSTLGHWKPGPSAAVILSDTPPTDPRPGLQWGDTTTLVLYLWYDDGTSANWVEFGTIGGSGIEAVPTSMVTGQTFTVAENTQVLFSALIDVGDATLDVSGDLIEVN
jgi:hypothetical protein